MLKNLLNYFFLIVFENKILINDDEYEYKDKHDQILHYISP